MADLTQILQAVEKGEETSSERLLPLVYDELRRLAAVKMASERGNQTLQPTALVHEAWLRLTTPGEVRWENRGHFFSAAAEAMRRILIENARRKQAVKRGGGWERLDLDHVEIATQTTDEAVLAIDEALEKLAYEDAKAAELVKLRFFGGLTLEEAGQALGLSERTARRYWAFARAWLYDEIQGQANR